LEAFFRSSRAAINGSVVSTGSSYFAALFASGLFTSKTLLPIFNITDAPGAIGSSDPPLLDRLPGLFLLPPISKEGTDMDIAIPVGADFEFFMGEFVGVDLGVGCLGDFDPKFQNEWDFLAGETAGDCIASFVSLRRRNTLGEGGAMALRIGVLSWKLLLSEVL
jgi:hypothetical protein